MATWTHAQPAVAEPVVRPRRATRSRAKARARARSRGGILWIALTGALLAGVVFVNVAVLRLNLALDSTNRTARRPAGAGRRRPVGAVGRPHLVAHPGAGAQASA